MGVDDQGFLGELPGAHALRLLRAGSRLAGGGLLARALASEARQSQDDDRESDERGCLYWAHRVPPGGSVPRTGPCYPARRRNLDIETGSRARTGSGAWRVVSWMTTTRRRRFGGRRDGGRFESAGGQPQPDDHGRRDHGGDERVLRRRRENGGERQPAHRGASCQSGARRRYSSKTPPGMAWSSRGSPSGTTSAWSSGGWTFTTRATATVLP